jgi:hypothetical protein
LQIFRCHDLPPPKLATNGDRGSIDKLTTALPNFILKSAS